MRLRLILFVVLLLSVAAPVVYYMMPFEPVGRPTVVGQARLHCGDVLLTQSFTGTADGYVVSFYYRPNGARAWAEYFVDADSPFWRGSVESAAGGEECSMSFHGSPQASFSCRDQRLAQHGRRLAPKAQVGDPMTRRIDGPMSPMDVGAESNDIPGYRGKP